MDRLARTLRPLVAWALAHCKTTLAAATGLFVGSLMLAPVWRRVCAQERHCPASPSSNSRPRPVHRWNTPEAQGARGGSPAAPPARNQRRKSSNIGGGFAAGRNQATLRAFTTPKAERERIPFVWPLESILRAARRHPPGTNHVGRHRQPAKALAAIPHVSDVESSFDDADPALSVEVKATRRRESELRAPPGLSTLAGWDHRHHLGSPGWRKLICGCKFRATPARLSFDAHRGQCDQRDADLPGAHDSASTAADESVHHPALDRPHGPGREVTLTANIQGRTPASVPGHRPTAESTLPPPGYRFDHGGSKDMVESVQLCGCRRWYHALFLYLRSAAHPASSQPLASDVAAAASSA